MIHILFYFTLLILTTFFWGYLFYKKDYHPQSVKIIIQSFIFGLFSMIPILAYKYIYTNFIPFISDYAIFQPFLKYNLLISVFIFLFNILVLYFLLFLLSSIVSVLLNFFKNSIFINIKKIINDEPLAFALVSLLLGVSIFLQRNFELIFNIKIIGTAFGSILFLAIIEEYIKHLMVRISDDKKIKDIDDAITLSIIFGLSFSFIETIFYAIYTRDITSIFYRSLITTPIHIIASGIFGYYYGLAHFSKDILKLEHEYITYKAKLFHRILSLKKEIIYKEEKIIEGIFFSSVFHATANIFFEFNLGFLVVPIIVLFIFLVLRLYKNAEKEFALILKFKRAKKTA